MSTLDDGRPLCFVLTPFGIKSDPSSGMAVDFDAVYEEVVRPAIHAAGLASIRADEEMLGGIIHKPMYERLLLCEYAVADLTTANANVYYELGVRHALRPRSTLLIFADGSRLPFDLTPMQQAVVYRVDSSGAPVDSAADRDRLTNQLRAARQGTTDSPVFELLPGLPVIDISSVKTDLFRNRVEYSNEMKERLAKVRREGVEAVRQVREELGDLNSQELGLIVELLLSFRAVGAWDDIIELVEQMPSALVEAPLVRQQYAFALNRTGENEKAESVLLTLIDGHGPSNETLGILGRVYKDRWETARRDGNEVLSRGLLDRAIKTYVEAFELDWRDFYPGFNAVELMELQEPPNPRRAELLPVVSYSLQRRLESNEPAYWDYATMLELAVLDEDEEKAMSVLPAVLGAVQASWEPMSTLTSLKRLRLAREARGAVPTWMVEVERTLLERAIPRG